MAKRKKEIKPSLTVTFAGHSEIGESWEKLGEVLRSIISSLFMKEQDVVFFVGRDGDFDKMVTEIILTEKQSSQKGENLMYWVIPSGTSCAVAPDREKYDGMLRMGNKYHPNAIRKRNELMVDYCDLLIAYVKREGGAQNTLNYAKKKGKEYINLATICG